jgi:PAS domain S-box-containing protein/putative nucleotidyltransferase with HDIG domain
VSELTASLNQIIDQSSNEILICDQETLKFLYANKSVISNLGYSMEELSDMSPVDICPEQTIGSLRQLFSTVSAQSEGITTNFETIHKRKDKTVYPVEIFTHETSFNNRPAYIAFILDITQRRQDLERLELVLQGSSLGYWDWDYQTGANIVNDRWLEMLGLERSDIKNDISDWSSRVHPDDLKIAKDTVRECIKNNQPYTTEFRMRHKNGSWVWVQGSGAVVTYDSNTKEPLRLCGTHQDISTRKAAEAQTKYIKRVLKTLIDITKSVNSAASEAAILQQTCSTLIETGGYRLAWIGYAEQDDQKTVRPMAQSGLDDGYVKSTRITWADTARGQGPVGTAIRQQTPIVTSDIGSDPAFKPWRQTALKHGYHSCVALPLIIDKEVLGSINIYASESYAFDEDALVFLKDLASTVAFGIKNQRLLIENASHLSVLESSLIQTINAIALALEKRDPYTAGHMSRVAQLSVAIAKKLTLSPHQVDGLRLSATIHDLGKIYVPAEILNRPGKLTVPEFEIIKSHSQVGYDIVKGINFPWEIAQIILQHHERLDGSGYPNGLKGGEILLEAQILSVADTVEAMSSHRPYRPALSIRAALKEISKNKGNRYNPAAVDACMALFNEDGFEFNSSF